MAVDRQPSAALLLLGRDLELVPGSMAWVNRWRPLLRWPLGVAVVLAMLAAPIFDALVLANQARPGDGLKVGSDAPHCDFSAIELLAERLQARHRLGLSPP